MTIDAEGLKALMELVWEQRLAMNYWYVAVDLIFIALFLSLILVAWRGRRVAFKNGFEWGDNDANELWVVITYITTTLLPIISIAIICTVIPRIFWVEQAVVRDIMGMLPIGGS